MIHSSLFFAAQLLLLLMMLMQKPCAADLLRKDNRGKVFGALAANVDKLRFRAGAPRKENTDYANVGDTCSEDAATTDETEGKITKQVEDKVGTLTKSDGWKVIHNPQWQRVELGLHSEVKDEFKDDDCNILQGAVCRKLQFGSEKRCTFPCKTDEDCQIEKSLKKIQETWAALSKNLRKEKILVNAIEEAGDADDVELFGTFSEDWDTLAAAIPNASKLSSRYDALSGRLGALASLYKKQYPQPHDRNIARHEGLQRLTWKVQRHAALIRRKEARVPISCIEPDECTCHSGVCGNHDQSSGTGCRKGEGACKENLVCDQGKCASQA
jgi:hypothetical protein